MITLATPAIEWAGKYDKKDYDKRVKQFAGKDKQYFYIDYVEIHTAPMHWKAKMKTISKALNQINQGKYWPTYSIRAEFINDYVEGPLGHFGMLVIGSPKPLDDAKLSSLYQDVSTMVDNVNNYFGYQLLTLGFHHFSAIQLDQLSRYAETFLYADIAPVWEQLHQRFGNGSGSKLHYKFNAAKAIGLCVARYDWLGDSMAYDLVQLIERTNSPIKTTVTQLDKLYGRRQALDESRLNRQLDNLLHNRNVWANQQAPKNVATVKEMIQHGIEYAHTCANDDDVRCAGQDIAQITLSIQNYLQ